MFGVYWEGGGVLKGGTHKDLRNTLKSLILRYCGLFFFIFAFIPRRGAQLRVILYAKKNSIFSSPVLGDDLQFFSYPFVNNFSTRLVFNRVVCIASTIPLPRAAGEALRIINCWPPYTHVAWTYFGNFSRVCYELTTADRVLEAPVATPGGKYRSRCRRRHRLYRYYASAVYCAYA